jgi:hypothetical protein
VTKHVIVAKDETTLNTPLAMSRLFSGRQGICRTPLAELFIDLDLKDWSNRDERE